MSAVGARLAELGLALPPVAAPAGGGLRVLVIEDNRDAADSLQMLLELTGCAVRVAYTGPDGVRAAEEHRPEVIICDIGLPGMDGYELARRLRDDPATRGVVLAAVSGYGRDQDRARSREAGFDHHFLKPADPAALAALLTGYAWGDRGR